MHTWKDGINSYCSEGLEDPTIRILLVSEGVRGRNSTPCSVGLGLPGLGSAEWIRKPWLLWLFYLCTVPLYPLSLPKHLCLWVLSPSKGGTTLSGWSSQVAQRALKSIEIRAGHNGVFSSLGIQMRAFFQLGEETLSNYTKAWTLPDHSVQANLPGPLCKVLALSTFMLFFTVWPDSVLAGQ